ncbi:hypothetical protein IB279_13785 [Ensifer sp. ENS06]|uniref:toxin TcdB middle/N-terminal domain-containing protein n=1 Tax=Ensifer sp. ENS06 TaxID=2769276 RepID=UPI00177BFF90|nr:toxin TcdB middle/N-terminal domain-containing protein [Ensifer sp. ENS06]MBD9624014.1 hypothetical protein [Ensifer sp. ENS06]
MRHNLLGFAALAATVSFALSSGAGGQRLYPGGLLISEAHAQGAIDEVKTGGGFGNGASALGAVSTAAKSGPKDQLDTAVDRTLSDNEGDAEPAAGHHEKSEPELDTSAQARALKHESVNAQISAETDGSEPYVQPQFEKRSLPALSDNSGNLTYLADITAPAFRGLEPKLALNYSSSRRAKRSGAYQAWLGFGWGLTDIDVIERGRPHKGVPSFSASDVYYLNDEELVACTTSISSPSCSTGGTHVTERESFRRVKFTASNNRWEVTETNGRVSAFKSVAEVSGVTPAVGAPTDLLRNSRWLLSSRTDANGNSVSYNYDCSEVAANPLTGVCYPSKIAYTGALITFYFEARPDYVLAANGHNIAETKRRLKTVLVTSGGKTRTVYTVEYDQAPVSNASRLTRIRQFGSDAVVASNGSVTAGSELPPIVMTYANFAGQFGATINTETLLGRQAGGISGGVEHTDLNNDGVTEIVAWETPPTSKTRRVNEVVLGIAPDNTIRKVGDIESSIYEGRYIGRFSESSKLRHVVYKSASGVAKAVSLNDAGAISLSDCSLPANSVPAATCNLAGQDKALMAFDYDGDGVDTLYKTGHPAMPGKLSLGGASLYGDGETFLAVQQDGQGSTPGKFEGAAKFASQSSSGVSYPAVDANGNTINLNCWGGNGFFCSLSDVNGDGISDLVVYAVVYNRNSQGVIVLPAQITKRVLLGSGRSFILKYTTVISKDGMLQKLGFADVDGDGLNEIEEVYFGTGPISSWRCDLTYEPTSEFELSSVFSMRFGAAGANLAAGPTLPNAGLMSDLNGDGLADIGFFTAAGRPSMQYCALPWDFLSYRFSRSGVMFPNLLTSVRTQLGAVIKPEYAPSSRFKSDYLPHVSQVVTKLTVEDGRGGRAITDVTYAKGRYDPKEQVFLGFGTVTKTLPLANGEAQRPVMETTYRQDLATFGQPSRTILRGSAGVVSKSVVEAYSVQSATKPYRAFHTATETTLTESGGSIILRQERSFDTYGNITQVRDFGRKDLTGDETWTVTSYSPNTAAYIVSAPRARNVRSGGFTADVDVYEQHEVYFYDGAASDATAPTKGNLTVQRSYASVEPTSSYRAEAFTYDSYGNRLTRTDGVGNRTEWDYDATYRLHVVKERAAKYFANGSLTADTRFVSNVTPNLVCGTVADKTDWNGIKETFTYDAFCRPYGYTNSGTGKYVKTRYETMGNPATQAVVSYEPLATGAGDVFQRTYYDGLGRSWRKEAPGEVTGGPKRVTDTAYDPRGNVAKVALPRFSDGTAFWSVHSYDSQDRVVKTVNPDASQRTYSYNVVPTVLTASPTSIPVYETLLTDEEEKVHRTVTDKGGNAVLVATQLSGTWVSEYRSYDALARLRTVRDHGGAIWNYSYDLRGNRLTASDPDLGNWTYVYDGADRLISQTDARGAITTLSYDQMGRPLTKKAKGPGDATPITVATNAYDTAEAGVGRAPFHDVGMLTMSANGSAKLSYSRSLPGSGTVLTTTTLVDGITHTTVETKGKADLPLSIFYSPGNVNVGSAAAPWAYNTANQLTKVPGYISAGSYEADGQTASITYENGVVTTFAYAPQRRWLSRVTTKKGTTALMDNQYARDAVGRIKTVTGLTTSDSWGYAYDDLGRLVTANNTGNNSLDETFTYSPSGNLLSRTRVPGAYVYPAGTAVRPHAATKIGTKTLSYDLNGNRLSDGARTLVWNSSNLLQSVTQAGAVVIFGYGPDGARAMKTWAFGKMLYAGANVEIDRTTPGSEVFTRYPHPDIKITTAAGATSKSFLHRDHLSSVRLVTNEVGSQVEATGYAAYGERTNAAMKSQKGYIGERFDAETGFMYLNARYYDAAYGRFVPSDAAEREAKGGDARPVGVSEADARSTSSLHSGSPRTPLEANSSQSALQPMTTHVTSALRGSE